MSDLKKIIWIICAIRRHFLILNVKLIYNWLNTGYYLKSKINKPCLIGYNLSTLLKLKPLCNSILPLQIDFESLGHSPNCYLLELPSNSYIVSGTHNFPKLALKSPKPCMNKNNIVVFIRIKTNLDTVSRAKQKQFLFLSVICLMEPWQWCL